MEYHADRDSYICLNGRELTVTNECRSKTTSEYVSVKTYPELFTEQFLT